MSEEITEESALEYQEYEGNYFLIYQEQLRDVRVENPVVQIPETVRIIRREAFLNEHLENKMETLLIPSSVKRIDRLTFNGLEQLSHAEIASGITRLEPGTFRNCIGLKTVVLPETLRVIESRAFENCISLESVVFMGTEPEVRPDAFSGCSSLTNEWIEAWTRKALQRQKEEERNKPMRVPLKFSAKHRDDRLFLKETGVEMQQSAPELAAETQFCIQNDVLLKCETDSEKLVIPEGVKALGKRALYGLAKVREIEFPSSLTEFGAEALEGTAWLKARRSESNYVLVNGVLISAFYESIVLEAKLPAKIKRIAARAFYDSKIQRVVIPESVKEIDAEAFFEAEITEIEFQGSEQLIFHVPIIKNCSELKEVLFSEKTERIEAGFVENCPKLQRVCLKGAGTAVHKNAFPEQVRIWVL